MALPKTLSPDEAKRVVLDHLATGARVKAAMLKVNRSGETYRAWMRDDAVFKDAVGKIREQIARGEKAKTPVPDFPEFCAKYLKKPLPFHHLRAWDVLNGREPRDLRDSMQYQKGAGDPEDDCRCMIINFPPDHAKSTVWNVQYTLWSIVQNPDIRIAIVSKSQSMAKKFLSQVKFYLGNPNLFPELHAAFAPEGGWKSDDKSDGLAWRENMIYVKGREQAEKEPTVEALGIGGHIYGARFDKMILDDIEDYSTASAYQQHADLIGQDIYSRLDKDHGELLILGTRVGVVDIYRWLRDEAKTEDGEPFYTYFAQPAILENESSHSDEWEVLWPERLGAKKIAKAKAAMTDPRRFTFVYQQRDVNEFAVFPPNQVEAAVNGLRKAGLLVDGAPGHRDRGMDGMYVVASWDPASSAGHNAMIVGAVQRGSAKRWILDVWNKKGVTSAHTIPKLKELTLKYGVNEWRIEKNAVQQFITQLPEIRRFLTENGCVLKEHSTYSNKYDPHMGVEGTLVPLFNSCVDPDSGRPLSHGSGLIELPARKLAQGTNAHVHELCEQLKAWEPNNKRLVQDLVMALWFCELGMREYLRGGQGNITHLKSRFTSRRGLASRVVIPFNEAAAQGMIHAV